MSTAAVYYFTDGSEKRPVYCEKELDKLKAFAHELGYQDVTVYCDKSLKDSEHTELRRFLAEADRYDALVVKAYRFVAKSTGHCLEELRKLLEKGLKVYSMADGQFLRSDPPLGEPLKVVTYISKDKSGKVEDLIDVQNGIFRNYARRKTNWTIADQYSDIAAAFLNNQDQVQLEEMIKHRDEYDLLLVRSFNDLHWRALDFGKVRQRLGLPIYSLEEGYLPIEDVPAR